MRMVTVTVVVSPEAEHELDQLLPIMQGWTNNGTLEHPFKDCTKDDVLQKAIDIDSPEHILQLLKLLKRILNKEKSK